MRENFIYINQQIVKLSQESKCLYINKSVLM